MPVWYPTAGDVEAIHLRVIEETGGDHGVLNRNTISAAVSRARWGPFPEEPDLALRAAFLVRGLVVEHPFADGNKRTGFEALDVFLARNGARLHVGADEAIAFMLALAEGRYEVEEVAAWVRAHLANL